MKRALGILTLLIVFTAMLAALPSVADAGVTLTKSERAVLRVVNEERTQRGLRALRFNAALTKAARSHVRDMARNSYFSHTSLNGKTVSARARSKGYRLAGCSAWKTGEVLARTFVFMPSASARQIVNMWMRSPSHRKVILSRSFRDAGVGIRTGGLRKYTVLDLGLRVR